MGTQDTDLQDWLGRKEQREEEINAKQVEKMISTMSFSPLAQGNTTLWQREMAEKGAIVPINLPHAWHWIFFNGIYPAVELGRDGHPQKGGYLPPVKLPRRMWAGGRLQFHEPLPLGSQAEKLSVIEKIEEKEGRSGKLCFVKVRHEIFTAGRKCISEWQDIVYREDSKVETPNNATPAKPVQRYDLSQMATSLDVTPDPVWLFRYSALTFNGHRIHYDLDYAQNVEAYPHLVFHGPLTATLLTEMAAAEASRQGKELREFSFRASSPLFANAPFAIHAGTLQDDGSLSLCATAANGQLSMSADAVIE